MGWAGLSRVRACRMFVFPDSFLPTRQVTSGSTVKSPESSADLYFVMRTLTSFTVLPFRECVHDGAPR
jgi:hypothetical protein